MRHRMIWLSMGLALTFVAGFLLAGCSDGISPSDNRPPVIHSLEADHEPLVPYSAAVLKVEAEDPDQDSLSYVWDAATGQIRGEGSSVAWQAPEQMGRHVVTVAVTNGWGHNVSESIELSVVAPQPKNQPPTILSVQASPTILRAGQTATLTVEAFDVDGEVLSYVWSEHGQTIGSNAQTITWTAPLEEEC